MIRLCNAGSVVFAQARVYSLVLNARIHRFFAFPPPVSGRLKINWHRISKTRHKSDATHFVNVSERNLHYRLSFVRLRPESGQSGSLMDINRMASEEARANPTPFSSSSGAVRTFRPTSISAKALDHLFRARRQKVPALPVPRRAGAELELKFATA
ncbi:hypothetical protein Q7O44_15415 [Shigella flexneri]|nr:hypothetical protein [Shigella flexneri]